MEYLFSSSNLYSVGGGLDPAVVVPDTLVCYDVKQVHKPNFIGTLTWEFKVKGHGDTLYKTHYEWALVENTPENLQKLKALNDQQALVRRAIRERNRLSELIAKAPKE